MIKEKFSEVRKILWKHFIDPETYMLYDHKDPGQKNLPTREEIKANIPNTTGWTTGMEDCALNGSMYLCGLLEGYHQTKEIESKGLAKKIYSGLELLGSVSPTPGFLARGVLPDAKTHYINSSVDQYTMWVYAMWRYYHSEISSEEERKKIIRMVEEVCQFIESSNFNILTEEKKPSIVGSCRNLRGLEFFLIAYNLTGNRHWYDIYIKLREGKNQSILKEICDWMIVETSADWAVLQDQIALRSLYELEKEFVYQNVYATALRIRAEKGRKMLERYKEYNPEIIKENPYDFNWRRDWRKYLQEHPGVNTAKDPHIGFFVMDWWANRPALQHEHETIRIPFEGMLIILLSEEERLIEELGKECESLISHYDYNLIGSSSSLAYIEFVYYLGLRNSYFDELFSFISQAKDSSYFQIDLRPYCNVGFVDNNPFGQINENTGWTGDGPTQDLRAFPTGRQVFHQIPFDIINQEENRGKSCIILRGRPPRDRSPYVEKVEGIKVDKKASFLFFLQTGWILDNAKVKKIGQYIVYYEDGISERIEIVNWKNILNFYQVKYDITKVFSIPVLKVKNKEILGRLYIMPWKNPHPEKIIRDINFLKIDADSMPILLAITGI